MKLRHLTTSALALILIAGCDDDEGTGLDPDDIAGTWTATSMLFTEVAAPNDEVDLVVDEGAVLTLGLAADGTYTFTFVLAPENEDEAGTYTTTSTTITITPMGEAAETFGLVRDEDVMTLTDTDTFDFNDDGTETAATLVITLTRP